MPEYKPDTKSKRTPRRSALGHSDKLRHAAALLREIDSLALLLNQVKTQTERIQAAADAIGDEVFQELGPRGPSSMNGARPTEPERLVGPKLVARPRTDRPFSV